MVSQYKYEKHVYLNSVIVIPKSGWQIKSNTFTICIT